MKALLHDQLNHWLLVNDISIHPSPFPGGEGRGMGMTEKPQYSHLILLQSVLDPVPVLKLLRGC